MIPLGSCTMKLNATSETISITWPEFANIHPFAPLATSLRRTSTSSGDWLCEATGMPASACSPNAGSLQGEYRCWSSRLILIRTAGHRNICLIPVSPWHQPASAQMAVHDRGGHGPVMHTGQVDMADLKPAREKHSDKW
jgi:glycine dehydrogenase